MRNPDVAVVGASRAIELADGQPPARITLMPSGTLHARDGRRWRLEAPDDVVAATVSRAGTVDLPIDYGHQTQHAAMNGQPAPAAGWLREFRVEGGAITAAVEWTKRAAKALRRREFRYISPTFLVRRGVVMAITGAAVTNTPALDLPALAEDAMDNNHHAAARILDKLGLAADADDAAVDAALARVADRRAAEIASAALAPVAEALGLAQDAQAEQVIAAARRRQPDPGEYVPRSEFDSVARSLQELQTARAEERATAAVDAAISSGRLTPAQRDWALGYARADAQGFKTYVDGAPVIVAPGRRAPALPPGGDAALTDVELDICRRLGVDEKSYRAEVARDRERGVEI